MRTRLISAMAAGVGALVLSGCVASMSTTTASKPLRQTIVPDSMKATYDSLQFAPATRAGDMLFLSGVVAVIEDGETTIDPAVARMFSQIEVVLAEADADWSDVVDVTSYTTDLDAHVGPLWAAKAERIGAPYPSWTLIGVDRLYGGEAAIIETKVVAYLPNR